MGIATGPGLYLQGGRYTSEFYAKIDRESASSARRVVPALVATLSPRSVIDIGCGTGAWLEVFWALGVDVAGVDAVDVPDALRRVPYSREWDLRRRLPALGTFDLAMSLEVAEHLPMSRADSFVADLASLSDVILFSAAVPGQGGDGHVNEQPHEYWIERFSALGYTADPEWRDQFRDDSATAWWYRQNMIIFRRIPSR